MSGIGRHLNRRLEVWRTTTVDDGAGGQDTTLLLQGTIRAKVDQPSPTERLVAQQADSKHSHDAFMLPTADVLRGDELRGTDGLGQAQKFRVLSVVQPSRPIYSKALCELIQTGG
ncbi:head-tail adaptor protein [Streptomyces sp. NPDC002994]|uniref:phage head completion protein n=1 Tax=Streptomyces sp. NPDC002994 TaxID=3154441 RepID=UPI0033BE15A8